jgi:hypothetical protein
VRFSFLSTPFTETVKAMGYWQRGATFHTSCSTLDSKL